MTISLVTKQVKDALLQESSPQKLPSLRRVDLICAYIQKSGLDELRPFFESLAWRDPPVPVRILTTSQMNNTQPEAVYQLALLPEVEIKVFTATFPIFHAKGWLFVHQDEISNVAIVGSSNISKSAVSTGIEWNIRTTIKEVTGEFQKAFESYWAGGHEAFVQRNVVTYDSKNRDWASLSAIFPSQVEPICTDINSGCNHPECLKLREDYNRLENRRNQIIDSFHNKNQSGLQKQPRPPENGWNLPQYPEPKIAWTGMDEVQQSNSLPPFDSMDVDENDQVSSNMNPQNTVEAPKSLHENTGDLQRDFFYAILNSDEGEAREKIKIAKSNHIVKSEVPHDILQMAQKSTGKTALEMYDLHTPLLFGIAFSGNLDIIKMLVEEGADLGPFEWKSEHTRTETIFHVLACLQPKQACAIFEEIRKSHRVRFVRQYGLGEYNSPFSPGQIAKMTAEASPAQDKSFVKALKDYLSPGKSITLGKRKLKLPGKGGPPKKKRYQPPESYTHLHPSYHATQRMKKSWVK
jgi:HKD family nuclease